MTQGRRKPGSRSARAVPVSLARRRLILKLRTSIESNRGAINDAVDRVLDLAVASGMLAEEGRAELEIALREALANAVIHGNKGSADKRVLLRCYFDPGHGMLLAVRDEGRGFDPDRVPDPRSAERLHLTHGRGIFLMRELMDAVEHRKGGREVVLYKKIPAAAAARGRTAARRTRG